MIPEDQVLDPAFFLAQQPLILYRLARAKYANLSGIGAALAPGRWNLPGEEAIYTSTETGVPLLERLAHTPKNLIPSNLALMKIRLSGTWEPQGKALVDGATGSVIWLHRSIADARKAFANTPSAFAGGMSAFAVAVPSVIVPAWNVILFPRAEGFWKHVSLQSVEPFQFDARLFPENTPVEPEERHVQG